MPSNIFISFSCTIIVKVEYNIKYHYKGSPINSPTQTLSQQFNSFYTEHKPKNFEDAVEKFAIFGGVGWGSIDTAKPTFELIEELILRDYKFIRNDISDLTTGMPLFHSILTGIAMGDGRVHSALKRANVEKEVGEKAILELEALKVIYKEESQKEFISWAESQTIDAKLYFYSPFMRFWFAFVSPLFKGIKEGNFEEVKTRFANREAEFVNLTFTQLSQEFIKQTFKEEKVLTCKSYWDNKSEIDIYAKTASGKTIVGTCKYANAKVKKSELSKLQEFCLHHKIKADVFVLFSKRGFSNELKALKSESLKLYSVKSFKSLIS